MSDDDGCQRNMNGGDGAGLHDLSNGVWLIQTTRDSHGWYHLAGFYHVQLRTCCV